MFVELLLFLVTVLLTFILYKIWNVDRRHFQRRNLKYVSQFAHLKILIGVVLNRYTPIELAEKGYYEFPDERIYGTVFSTVQYMVRDPEIIKQIAIKDFDHFEDHQSFADVGDLWGSSLFFMKGQRWRQMRATLSPAFTGFKMRQMYELVSECADNFVNHLKGRVKVGETLNVEIKDLYSRYSNDVIASCAFGLTGLDSFAEPNNEFYVDGKELTNFTSPIVILQTLIIMFLPKVAKALKLGLSKALKFKNMVLQTMEFRKKNNIFRPDMINIMIQVRDGSLKYQEDDKSKELNDGFAAVEESEMGKASVNRHWNDDEIVAQTFLFFIAGFETVATMLTFTSYELVANPDIQQRLYEEIAEVNEVLGGERITYDALQKMKYLDQVICEAMRKWPPLVVIDRVCVKDYVFNDRENLKFDVEKGSVFFIPVFGIHHDPNYYPDPHKFNPDRFSDANKANILPGTYLPFGLGPRNCIGSRFALMELKVVLYNLLLNFSFEVNEKTDIPLKMKRSFFNLAMKNGMNLELKPRIGK